MGIQLDDEQVERFDATWRRRGFENRTQAMEEAMELWMDARSGQLRRELRPVSERQVKSFAEKRAAMDKATRERGRKKR